MASTNEDRTAASQQLRSMYIAKSAERKDNDSAPTTKNGTPTKLLCSECGKKSSTLKKCTACQCVWYCDKKCQNKHWKEHKKECKLIKKELDKRGGKLDVGTEEVLGPLPDLPPREECPICMHVLPIAAGLQTYFACCGKTICGGCNLQHLVKSEERADGRTCAFCRETVLDSDEEILARYRKRVERNDPNALLNMAYKYGFGRNGLQMDQAKCIDLMRQAAALGNAGAQFQLGNYHLSGEMGLEQSEEERLEYWEKSTEVGHVEARHNLGCAEDANGDHVAAMRHWRLSASGGSKASMGALIGCFEHGLLQHKDLAETLQVFYRARAEMKSEDRDQYISYLKETGEYEDYIDP